MPLKLLAARQVAHQTLDVSHRLKEIDAAIARLQRERRTLATRLERLPTKAAGVSCPRCARDRDFLTDNGGYLARVLEDPADTEALEPGKPIYCPGCSNVFLYAVAMAPT